MAGRGASSQLKALGHRLHLGRSPYSTRPPFQTLTTLHRPRDRQGWNFIVGFLGGKTGHALEKEMATHSSILAWRIPGTGAAVYGVTQSQTQVKRLSSSSSIFSKLHNPVDGHLYMLSVFGIKLFLTLLVRFL